MVEGLPFRGNSASEDHCVVSILVQFVPYHLEGGWSPDHKEKLKENVVRTLEQYAPGISKNIVNAEGLSPVDLEDGYNLINRPFISWRAHGGSTNHSSDPFLRKVWHPNSRAVSMW